MRREFQSLLFIAVYIIHLFKFLKLSSVGCSKYWHPLLWEVIGCIWFWSSKGGNIETNATSESHLVATTCLSLASWFSRGHRRATPEVAYQCFGIVIEGRFSFAG